MRISDWSSDVCSSDLLAHRRRDADDQRILLGGAAQPVAENLRVAERTAGFLDRKCPSNGIELGDAVIFDRVGLGRSEALALGRHDMQDRKSTRLNSSH